MNQSKWGNSLAPFFLILIAVSPMLLQGFLMFTGASSASIALMGGESSAGSLAQPAASGAREYRPEEYRLMLLLSLDLLVRSERVLKKEFGGYTQALGRVPDVLGASTLSYRVEITKADFHQLAIRAMGQGSHSSFDTRAVSGDELAIDGNFEVRSNFPLPVPPRDYLITVAKNVLAHLPRSPDEIRALEGIYHGYFSYERRPRSDEPEKMIWVAVGKNGPIGNDVITLDPQEVENPPDLYRWVYEYRRSRWPEQEARSEMEKIFVAQKIKKAHARVFSTTLSDLASHWNSLGNSLIPAGSKEEGSRFQLEGITSEENTYQAEIAEHNGSSARHWVVSDDGKAQEKASMADIEGLMNEFDAARRRIASPSLPLEAPIGEGSFMISDPASGKPLLIDVMDNTESLKEETKNFDSSK